MAKPNHEREPDDKEGSPPEVAAWGTWEELLLAYAVNRYGTNGWDSISSELRKRSSAPIVFTPKHCKQKYQELERRFAQSNGDVVDIDDGSETTAAADVPWIQELRKFRVEELQRKLQNFDIYISSLQLKVKKLTEEKEKNGCGERTKKQDLGQKIDEIEIKNEEEMNNKPPDPVISYEEQVPGGDESDRDNQSVNGSNGNLDTGAEKSENESRLLGIGGEKPGSSPHSPIGVEDSCNGRSDAKEPVKAEPDGGASEAPESKSEGTMKENSDVQSSASKSRKERSDRVRRGSNKVDGREDEDQAKDSIPVRSLPLVDILQKVHKLGSAFFERRLDIQEKLRYKNLIREHIDFEILQIRLQEGWYSDGNNKFFRDLLLLVNNTCIFFSNESPEAAAAIELRLLILKEIKQKTDSKSLAKQGSSKPTALPPKRAPEPPDSMLLKPKLAGPMTVCRKRSSITAKASGSSSDKQSDEKETPTKRTSDGFPSNAKKTSKNICGRNDILEAHSDQEQGKASASENSDMKKKNKKPTDTEEKKRSAAKFLNRMNQSSSTSNNEAVGMAAGGGSENDSRGGGEQKRGGANKGGEGKKDQGPKRSSVGRQLKEPDSLAKRSVGRPPKKAVAQPLAAGKRNRECAESESSVSKQAKKRSKRL